MRRIFKNALCLARRPDTWSGDPNHCKRKGDHLDAHWIRYSDGKVAVWQDGFRDAIIYRSLDFYRKHRTWAKKTAVKS